MGNKVNKLCSHKIGFFGLCESGKTTLLYQLKDKERIDTLPTMQRNHEYIHAFKANLSIYDYSGQQQLMPTWEKCYSSIEGIVYIFDVNDVNNYEENKVTLKKLSDSKALKHKPFLILANKKDLLPKNIDIDNIKKAIGFDDIAQEKKLVFISSIVYDEPNFEDGFKWLNHKL